MTHNPLKMISIGRLHYTTNTQIIGSATALAFEPYKRRFISGY